MWKRVGGPGGRRTPPPWWSAGGADLEVLAERRTAMVGSLRYNPGEVAERPKAHAWKACIRQRIVGSNPTLSAICSSEWGVQGGGGPRPPGGGAERRIEERFGGAESAMVGKQEVVKVLGELAERP